MNFLKKMFDKFKVDALIVDSSKGRLFEVEEHIRNGVNVNGTDPDGNTAICSSANVDLFANHV